MGGGRATSDASRRRPERTHPGRPGDHAVEACRKVKELGYPHELWTTRLLARHACKHGPAEGHPCLANTKMTVARVAARLVLRRLKGRGRKSSPSSVSMSRGILLDFVIVLARVQDIEIGNTVNPKDDSFAINKLICSTPRQRQEFSKRLRPDRKQPDQNGGGLQNQVRDFKSLARNPLGYRYTIPQEISDNFHSRFNYLGFCQAVACGRIRKIPPKRAPFYPLGPGLGKRAAMRLLEGAAGEAAAMCGADRVAAGAGTHEHLF